MNYYNENGSQLGRFSGRLPNGKLVSNYECTEEEPNSLGYYRKSETKPESLPIIEGKDIVTKFKINSELNVIEPYFEYEDVVEESFEFSPYKMEESLELRGGEIGIDCLAILDSIIEQAGYTRKYKRASVLNSGDPTVKHFMDVIASAFGWTKEEIKAKMNEWRV